MSYYTRFLLYYDIRAETFIQYSSGIESMLSQDYVLRIYLITKLDLTCVQINVSGEDAFTFTFNVRRSYIYP